MTQFSVELSPDAKQQVDSIARYIAVELGNVSASLTFLDDVETSLENIRDNPIPI
jgi:plasmid stabilization system protein ParE